MHIPYIRRISASCWLSLLVLVAPVAGAAASPLGIFQDHQDVGTVLHPGTVEYDPARQAYTISGSGANMWFGEDDFHYLWTKVSGDVSLTADIAFIGATGNNHRKAMDDKKVHVLAKLFGGQGTINVPSWSPDSKKPAFVSYELLPEESVNGK